MSSIRSSASERCVYIVAMIFSFGEIMPTYSRCVLKGLVYITIIAPLGCQPFFYTKCTKLNMRLSCNVKLVFNTKCTFLIHSYILQSLRLPYLICFRVLYNSYYRKARL